MRWTVSVFLENETGLNCKWCVYYLLLLLAHNLLTFIFFYLKKQTGSYTNTTQYERQSCVRSWIKRFKSSIPLNAFVPKKESIQSSESLTDSLVHVLPDWTYFSLQRCSVLCDCPLPPVENFGVSLYATGCSPPCSWRTSCPAHV